MPQPAETVVATLPGSNDGERVVMVLIKRDGESRIEMRQQSWCEQFGWYTQSRIELEPQQVAAMRNALSPAATSTGLGRRFSRIASTSGFQPRVVHADSA